MSHYIIGSSEESHKGVKVTTIVGNPSADKYIESISIENYQSGFVPAEYHNRPDLISTVFYGDPDRLWYLCLISNKFDVFEDFRVGSRIALD